MISLIAAMSTNRVIGRDQELPWHLPEDLKFFKDKTKGKIVVMGRKTFDSLGQPLPLRLNLVISRSFEASGDNLKSFKSLSEALEYAKSQVSNWDPEIFVIGGAEIYSQALKFADRIYLTEIDDEFEGDTFFPEFDKNQFRLVDKVDSESEGLEYSFCTYEKAPLN